MGSAALTCTEVERIDSRGQAGRPDQRGQDASDDARQPPGFRRAGEQAPSPKAAAQARTSRACSVRCVDAVSPSVISSNVLFSTEGIVKSRGLTRQRRPSLIS